MENINEIRKQESIKAGYVNFGYFSPELSSTDEYPDYIREEVQRCIEKIKSHQTENSVTFGFMTDIHYSDTFNHNIRTKRLINAYKDISKAARADMLILGGDYVNDGLKAYKMNNYKKLAEHLEGIRYYPVNGNHDDNSIWDSYTGNEVSENHLSARELYDCFYSELEGRGAEFDKSGFGLYYLYNDFKSKIRYVFLDGSDIPEKYDKNGRLLYLKQDTFGISQAQADWLVNHALRIDETGWRIVIIAHSIHEEYLELAVEIADAFSNRSILKKAYSQTEGAVSVNADFTDTKAEIMCFICGHYHTDFIKYTQSGIPCIYCGNVIMYQTKLPRTDGDKSELQFDFVTITENKIYMTKVGAGESRQTEKNRL